MEVLGTSDYLLNQSEQLKTIVLLNISGK